MFYIRATYIRGGSEIVVSGLDEYEAAYLLRRFAAVNPTITYTAWKRV